ncbi:hypothetical protein VTL71DRAFT_4454 [Oculimacula yallundae]|uniref:Altered inheritance of mitochondria protein 6 n=1 Tax=Oculimacula yallundae TaxID=86028 RepID=A0ABR4C225_9HELO
MSITPDSLHVTEGARYGEAFSANLAIPKWKGLKNHTHARITRQWKTVVLIMLFLVLSLVLAWAAIFLTVANRFYPAPRRNGIQQIIQEYHAPRDGKRLPSAWVEDFSTGVIPVQCHSHNDYWRQTPLYEGIAAGCISTEADIWIKETSGSAQADLLVGHNKGSLRESRTLSSLYLDPLFDILTHQNEKISSNRLVGNGSVGVFDVAPEVSFVLLLDFKTSDNATWDTVVHQLNHLRSRDWLTHWTPEEGIVQRPLTIVASGGVPFATIVRNTTYREIFYDAPLQQLQDFQTPFSKNNSYYASDSLTKAVGSVMFGSLSKKQMSTVTAQVQRAGELGLKSRYWDTPSWPIGWRNRIWDNLLKQGASMLNTDDLSAAARWDWQMCVVLGVNVCSS